MRVSSLKKANVDQRGVHGEAQAGHLHESRPTSHGGENRNWAKKKGSNENRSKKIVSIGPGRLWKKSFKENSNENTELIYTNLVLRKIIR